MGERLINPEVRESFRETLALADKLLATDYDPLELEITDEDGVPTDPATRFQGPIIDFNDKNLTGGELAFVSGWMEEKLGIKPEDAPIQTEYRSADGLTSCIVYDVALGTEEFPWYLSRWKNEGEKPSYILWPEESYIPIMEEYEEVEPQITPEAAFHHIGIELDQLMLLDFSEEMEVENPFSKKGIDFFLDTALRDGAISFVDDVWEDLYLAQGDNGDPDEPINEDLPESTFWADYYQQLQKEEKEKLNNSLAEELSYLLSQQIIDVEITVGDTPEGSEEYAPNWNIQKILRAILFVQPPKDFTKED